MLLFRDSLQESLQFCDIRKYTEGSSTSTDTVMTKHQADSLEPPMPALAGEQLSESVQVSSTMEGKVNSLKEMFPTMSHERITQALNTHHQDVQTVVTVLLGDIDAGLILNKNTIYIQIIYILCDHYVIAKKCEYLLLFVGFESTMTEYY